MAAVAAHRPCTVVVSQPMYFPWVGLLEQIRLADVFVHYDDVALARGFANRVQLKTATGSRWMTVPLSDWHRGQRIGEVRIDESRDWRRSHFDLLRQAYAAAPHVEEMLDLVTHVHRQPATSLADLSIASTMAVAEYFGLCEGRRFLRASALAVQGAKSTRLLAILGQFGGTRYVTGHGAKDYLEHGAFDDAGVEVRYMDYQRLAYPQLHGSFTPYVSSLDLIANCGRNGTEFICSDAVHWRDFLDEHG